MKELFRIFFPGAEQLRIRCDQCIWVPDVSVIASGVNPRSYTIFRIALPATASPILSFLTHFPSIVVRYRLLYGGAFDLSWNSGKFACEFQLRCDRIP
jgi:hypothetical protein